MNLALIEVVVVVIIETPTLAVAMSVFDPTVITVVVNPQVDVASIDEKDLQEELIEEEEDQQEVEVEKEDQQEVEVEKEDLQVAKENQKRKENTKRKENQLQVEEEEDIKYIIIELDEYDLPLMKNVQCVLERGG